MSMFVNKMKSVIKVCVVGICLCLTCMVLWGRTGKTEIAFASEVSETTETTSEEPAFTAKENFVIFTCCLFSVALCVVIGLFGNPNDRLKDKYKRARKQQQLEEKKKKDAEERAAKRAAEDAKYAEELAQYEADVKAYEEAKAAKAAAKAAKKAA